MNLHVRTDSNAAAAAAAATAAAIAAATTAAAASSSGASPASHRAARTATPTPPAALHVQLGPLSRGDVGRLALTQLGAHSISEAALNQLHALSQGNTYCLLQLLSSREAAVGSDGVARLRSEQLGVSDGQGDGSVVATAPRAASEGGGLPLVVSESVRSHLDSLDPGLALVLRVCAAVGRVVPLRALEHVHPVRDPKVRRTLGRVCVALCDLRLLVAEPDLVLGAPVYSFASALTLRVASDALPRRHRDEVRAGLLRWFTSRVRESGETLPRAVASELTRHAQEALHSVSPDAERALAEVVLRELKLQQEPATPRRGTL
jgi:hypothetical protein